MAGPTLPDDVQHVLRDLNPWWEVPGSIVPVPPPYRRRAVREISIRLAKSGRLIEVMLGPRQVGKTTAIHQLIEDLFAAGKASNDVFFVRFDLEILREVAGGLRSLMHWFADAIRRRSLNTGSAAVVFLDEIHKLPKWEDEVKHLADTFPVRLVITGSSSVLLARGRRESLAGRDFTTEFPTFRFREVLEAWSPSLVRGLPDPIRVRDLFDTARTREVFAAIHSIRGQHRHALKTRLERYYQRGGYPRLHSGEVDDDIWADYLVQTVFDSVLGADIPQLFPVQDPRLLRHLYLTIARWTGGEVSQPSLVEEAVAAGFQTTQPTAGRYLHYLADALLIRELKRYPLARKRSARVPAKLLLSDLGVRNAILRGAPSLWESSPDLVGPLIETLVQSVLRDHGLQLHFWRDYLDPANRRSPAVEVDFVAEDQQGDVVPVEVKFRRTIHSEDYRGLRHFRERFSSQCRNAVLVTRDTWEESEDALAIPLLDFLLAF